MSRYNMVLKKTILVGLVYLSGLTGFAVMTNQIDSAYQNQPFTTNLFASAPDMSVASAEMSVLGFIKALHFGGVTNLVSFFAQSLLDEMFLANDVSNVVQFVQKMEVEFYEDRAKDMWSGYAMSNAVVIVDGNTAEFRGSEISYGENNYSKAEFITIKLIFTNSVWKVVDWE